MVDNPVQFSNKKGDPPMSGATILLLILPANRPLRLTPTDVSQFVRLEQCERYLCFRLAERAGQKFMGEYDVIPQQSRRSDGSSGLAWSQKRAMDQAKARAWELRTAFWGWRMLVLRTPCSCLSCCASRSAPDGRGRVFDYEKLLKRDNVNLDIFWLRDKSLEESDDLPEPDVLAQEIVDDMQTALEQFQAIAEKLKA